MSKNEAIQLLLTYVQLFERNPILRGLSGYIARELSNKGTVQNIVAEVERTLSQFTTLREALLRINNLTLPNMDIWESVGLAGNSISAATKRLDGTFGATRKSRSILNEASKPGSGIPMLEPSIVSDTESKVA